VDGQVICFGVWSDKVLTNRDDRHPIVITVFNLSIESRLCESGMRVGGGVHERNDDIWWHFVSVGHYGGTVVVLWT